MDDGCDRLKGAAAVAHDRIDILVKQAAQQCALLCTVQALQPAVHRLCRSIASSPYHLVQEALSGHTP